ncbi:MAG: hypothetical protein A2Y45_04800 [Tenericutes bacterium GWC2_34_14]|nr:MAG: hypothetical protein A2Z84_00945 [Tenericutes bacterium GWA2_35_7]OHE29116.1 MAG: hypothetical protein A2Y45_04800 [Tenericutes bacterium GWC2_34_14]OHE34076.1 MAG: hypothetical protein A2012_05455 [Tenericutes bacterium GWE2_34_108]OHE35406.1 MAG: hypothetical protein A2Y46_04800 [Tenericutes bacterium GWF1_35_14]OHE42602.1 MAG: hypothetical protein A3K26_00440 [Tenericutes bacterium RIFOXYA12_FULL_35_10]OHE43088.1 MAG: hypothetical protein A2221_05515 [Tenericutes bacterium RIFOXYA2_
MKIIYVSSEEIYKLLNMIVNAFDGEMYWDFRAYNEWYTRHDISKYIKIRKEVILTSDMKKFIDDNYDHLYIIFLTVYVSITQPNNPIRNLEDLMNSNTRFAISVVDTTEIYIYVKNDHDFSKLYDLCNMVENSKVEIIHDFMHWDFDVSYILKK